VRQCGGIKGDNDMRPTIYTVLIILAAYLLVSIMLDTNDVCGSDAKCRVEMEAPQ